MFFIILRILLILCYVYYDYTIPLRLSSSEPEPWAGCVIKQHIVEILFILSFVIGNTIELSPFFMIFILVLILFYIWSYWRVITAAMFHDGLTVILYDIVKIILLILNIWLFII